MQGQRAGVVHRRADCGQGEDQEHERNWADPSKTHDQQRGGHAKGDEAHRAESVDLCHRCLGERKGQDGRAVEHRAAVGSQSEHLEDGQHDIDGMEPDANSTPGQYRQHDAGHGRRPPQRRPEPRQV